jgi:hypothetical protein
MQRREFLTKSCVTGVMAVGGGALLAQTQSEVPPQQPGESWLAYRARLAKAKAKQSVTQAASQAVEAVRHVESYYELRRYEIETPEQKAAFDKFLSEAALPAFNRLEIKPVGVFYPNEGLSPIYVLLPHRTFVSFTTLAQQLGEDKEYLEKGAEFLNAPADKPAYKNLEVQLMVAFEGMPQIETPTDAPGRIFQLRTYESPSEKTGCKKIEMFNTSEIAIFRKVGLHPVFFGQTVAGTKMPNLTYMLGFQDMDESKENWKKFGADPDWQKLRAMPEYLDKEILRQKGITNLYLKPASYSQI